MAGTQGQTDRLDEAARAGWLYYVAGNTQDEIAKKLGVSRQSAQRLVSLAVSEQLVKFRLDHPIARCMELSERVKARYGLMLCDVIPSDPSAPFSTVGLAQAGAAEMERHLRSSKPKTIAVGTGRALRSAVEQLKPMDCPHHTIVSLLGNVTFDGAATAFNVVIRMAERVNARHYPMPLPPLVRNATEREMLLQREPISNIINLAKNADVTFVGVGEMNHNAPMLLDGFINHDELRALEGAGAVGEITSWTFDRQGQLIEGIISDRVTSMPLTIDSSSLVCGIAAGEAKIVSIRGAMIGKLINGLITNEATAEQLLSL